MTQAERKKGPARLQLLLIAALFLGPLLFAAWMYNSGKGLAPAARSNHGELLEPIRHLADEYPEILRIGPGQWLLVYVYDGDCTARCQDALYAQRQSRLMLGNDMSRLTRVFLHGEWALDKVLADEQQAGLKPVHNRSLAKQLESTLPDNLPRGGFFLIDPLGNLVMYFKSDLDPREMVDDIKHLFDLSRIG
ncbi:MAG: hypothetical protein OEW68_05985 [Gammaproteobacteria bacterium]|nr:hypothetical protein [Gammaproteobacteria bacterium]MDH4314374.1 hypothetical protein [Gammaproteobacteria bacterium]